SSCWCKEKSSTVSVDFGVYIEERFFDCATGRPAGAGRRKRQPSHFAQNDESCCVGGVRGYGENLYTGPPNGASSCWCKEKSSTVSVDFWRLWGANTKAKSAPLRRRERRDGMADRVVHGDDRGARQKAQRVRETAIGRGDHEEGS